MDEKIIEFLKSIAKEKAWDDDEDFIVDDYAGGNVDDAFYGGQRSGCIDLARDILVMLGLREVANEENDS